MYSAIAGAVMWWSMYSIFGSECGGSLLIPAFSATEMSISRRGIKRASIPSWPRLTRPLLRGLHQLRRIGADAPSVAFLGTREAEVITDRLQSRERRLRIILRANHQRTRHPEHGIGVDMFVVAEVERGDQFAKTVAADQEVDVRWPEPVALLRLHHLTHRAVHRDRIAQRAHRA